MSQVLFPAITAASATNPLCYIEEPAGAFGVKITANPTYLAVSLAENFTANFNPATLRIDQAGSVFPYSRQTVGGNFPFHIDVSPLNINFIKIGCNAPNLTTPTGTSAASYQFLMKYKQSYGTAALVDTYMFLLGCKVASTNINVTPQGKVSVGMDWIARQIVLDSTATGGLTTPTIPTIASITGPVIVDTDAGPTPLTVDGKTYATDGFSLTVDTGLITKAYNGSGYIDVSSVGAHNVTGSFRVPVGSQGIALETLIQNPQVGVLLDYKYKTGAMFAHLDGVILTTTTREFPGAPTTILENPINFEARSCTLATS